MSARRVPLVDVRNRPGVSWLADLTEAQAEALGKLSARDLRLAQFGSRRNAAIEAAGRHYAKQNYR